MAPGKLDVGRGWIPLTVFLAALAYLAWLFPLPILGAIILFLLAALLLKLRDKNRLQKLISARNGESHCTFVRAFDCDQVDGIVIRAAYEELCDALGVKDFPLRPEDDLDDTLHFDQGELDGEIVDAISQRAQRSLDHAETNPYYGKIHTVRDLVLFFNNQPRQ